MGFRAAHKAIARQARALVRHAEQRVFPRVETAVPKGIPMDVLKLSATARGMGKVQRAQAGPYSIATFNLENFFPPGVGRLGDRVRPLKTTESQKALAETFKQLDADIVGIQEIYDAATMKRFVETHLSDMGYRFLSVTRGNDTRQINLGIVSRLPIKQVRSHTELPVLINGQRMPNKLCRDLLQATVEAPGGDVEIFVIHLKSLRIDPGHEIAQEARKRGLPFDVVKAEKVAETVAKQEAEAHTVRKFINAWELQNPSAKIALLGDGNNVPTSRTIQILLGQHDPGPDLHNVIAEELGPNAITHVSRGGHTSEIDQLDISGSLRKTMVPGSVTIVRTPDGLVGSDHLAGKFTVDPAHAKVTPEVERLPDLVGAGR